MASTLARASTPEVVEDIVASMVDPEVRASALLRRHCSREQRVTFASRGYFDVVSSGGRRYRITEGTCQNVYSLVACEDGTWYPLQCFCLVAPVLPIGDLLLAQKLLLETDEQRFLAEAVLSPIHAPPSWR